MFSYPKELKKMNVSNTSEDFSFPVITNPLANQTIPTTSSSSSLWRISSKVYHHHSDDEQERYAHDEDEDEDYRLEVRSMCEEIIIPNVTTTDCLLEKGSSFRRDDHFLSMEERMDFLWQNFNEEEEEEKVMRSCNNNNKQICLVKRSRMGRRRPNTLLVIEKLFKGLVSMRKSSHLRILKPRF